MHANLGPVDGNGGLGPEPALPGSIQGWKEVILASLPFLLILLLDLVPRLLVESGLLTWEAPAMHTLTTALGIISLGGAIVLVLFLAWRRIWPPAISTWYLIFGAALLLFLGALLSLLLRENPNFLISQGVTMYVAFPLIVAVALYAAARRNPQRGLLAALPALYIIWLLYNMEFVPSMIQAAVKVLSIALICPTISFLLHNKNWRAGLYVVIAMNLVVGALFSYAGIYYGGTLPFSASGPSLIEVALSLIPQYLATCAVVLGLLFAWKFRQMGHYGSQTGRFGYHLAPAGLLLVILANLASLALAMDSSLVGIASSTQSVWTIVIVLGLYAYLLGVAFTYREARFIPRITRWVERLLMLILPLAIPLAFVLPFISWTSPVSSLYGIPLLWEIPHGVSLAMGVGWMGLSVWVVTRVTPLQKMLDYS